MSFKAEKERNILLSCCLIRVIFFELLCAFWNPCSLITHPSFQEESLTGCNFHKRWGSLQQQPQLLIDYTECKGPHKSQESTGRCKAAKAGCSRTPLHMVDMPFSQPANTTSLSRHLLHFSSQVIMLVISPCFNAIKGMTIWE